MRKFAARPDANRRRVVLVVAIAVALFAVAIAFVWRVSSRMYVRQAMAAMTTGIGDFTEDFNTAPDSCLYYVGNAITSFYGTPDNARRLDVHELMSRYGIDELNVVDRNGIVLRGDLANEGFDFHSNGNTSEFLRLLTNDWTYAQRFRAAIEDPDIVRKYAGVAFPDHNGFVQIGFDEKRIRRDFDYHFRLMAQDWSLGTGGYFVLARMERDDEGHLVDGTVVSSGHPDFKAACKAGETLTLRGIGFDLAKILSGGADGEFFRSPVHGEECLCASRRLGKYHRLIVATPLACIERSRNESVGLAVVVLLFLFVIAAAFGVMQANRIAQQHRRNAEDRRRRAEELRNAKAIQTESLPTVFPDSEDYGIYARMDTAKEVGGDFYDFYTLPSGRQLFLIADTSGKGIPAAMFMMKAKAVIRAGLFEAPDFAAAVTEANERLAENNDATMFVTAWIGLFDRETGEIEFVNCGHNPPLVKHADGSVSWVRTRPGLALAAMGGVKYRVERLVLKRGESLFLYTDGATEAMNAFGEQYGERRLEADLADAPRFRFVETVRERVAKFVNGAEQSDDITLLALDYKER